MTSTTFDGSCFGKSAGPLDGIGPTALRALLSAAKLSIERWKQRRAVTQGQAESPPKDARYLTVIASYRDFIAANPDMPRDHRDQFLGAIIRCCEEAQACKDWRCADGAEPSK